MNLAKSHQRGILGLVAVAALVACTTVPEQLDCATADWLLIGADDAMAGNPRDAFQAWQSECRAAGQLADKAAYLQGYNGGLMNYCTLDNGLKVGLAKQQYFGICPKSVERMFLAGYLSGREQKNEILTPAEQRLLDEMRQYEKPREALDWPTKRAGPMPGATTR